MSEAIERLRKARVRYAESHSVPVPNTMLKQRGWSLKPNSLMLAWKHSQRGVDYSSTSFALTFERNTDLTELLAAADAVIVEGK